MLVGEGLTCVRDGRTLFARLNLSLEPGDVLQVQGLNGAGKTSLLRILCGLTLPREGTVYWGGNDIRQDRTEYHRELLYIGHNPGIKQELTALENLHFFRCLGGHTSDTTQLSEALDQVGLFGYEQTLVRNLSAGQRRRVALARLWLTSAPMWILDEPFTAIDRKGIHNLENRIAAHANDDGIVILTTHQPLDLAGCRLRHLDLQ